KANNVTHARPNATAPTRNHASQGLEIPERRASQTDAVAAPAKGRISRVTSSISREPPRAITSKPATNVKTKKAPSRNPAMRAAASAAADKNTLFTGLPMG